MIEFVRFQIERVTGQLSPSIMFRKYPPGTELFLDRTYVCGGPNETIYEFAPPYGYNNSDNNNSDSRSSDCETKTPDERANAESKGFRSENRTDGFRVRFSVDGKTTRSSKRGDRFLCCNDGAKLNLRVNGTTDALPRGVSKELRQKIGKNTAVAVRSGARLNVTVKIVNSAFAIDRRHLPASARTSRGPTANVPGTGTPADPPEKSGSLRYRSGEPKPGRKRSDGSLERLSDARIGVFGPLTVAAELKCRIVKRPKKWAPSVLDFGIFSRFFQTSFPRRFTRVNYRK